MRNMPFCMPVLLSLFALSGVGVSIHAPSAAAAPTVTATISVGSYPWGVGVNSTTNRIYVTNNSGNTVSVIDGATNTVTATISVGSSPSYVGVNPSTNRIYVSNGNSNTVSVIDGATNAVVSTISLSSPTGVGINSTTNRIYVPDYWNNTVRVIDGTTNTVVSTISVGSFPNGVGVNSSTNRIYVANEGGYTVSVIDGAANTVISTISVGSYPNGVGVNSSTNRIYVANEFSNTVSVIDGATNTVTSTISVGSYPFGVGVNSSTNRIYVSNAHSDTVSVIDGATNTVTSTVSVGSNPFGVGVNSSTNRIYVANYLGNTVSVIEDASSSAPTVTTGSATDVTSSSATLNGTVNANGASTTAWFQYGITSGSYSSTSTTQSLNGSSNTTVSIGISGLSASTTYYYRIAAQNSGGTSYGSEASFTTSAPADTTAPTGSITINSGASYTKSSTVTLNLSASDSVGVTGYYVSNSSSTPSSSASGWTSVTATTSYSASVSYSFSGGEGSKTIYAWYKDAAGNVSSAANASITLDTTSPTVTITSPTPSATYTTSSSTISLAGNASDSASGISTVTWSNNKGGSGTASGTTGWSISSIGLSTGENIVTVTATDGAGNTGAGTIKVTYTISAPTITTTAATNVTSNSATLNGTVNANGLATTAWFQYGISTGSYSYTTATQSVSGTSITTVSTGISGLLSNTTYYYRITAQNSAGTSYGSDTSFITPDASAPKGSVSINSGASYTNTTLVTLNLSATDDVMVSGYYISISSTTPASSASGWTSVIATTSYSGNVPYTLSSGDGSKTIYVWYKDSSGNVSSSASASIALDTTPPTVIITSPTGDDTYTSTSNTIKLGGSASDGISGIKTVTWSNSNGGNGTASGTTGWTISNISLASGDNVITVTATDNAGNSTTDKITVKYTVSVVTPTPTEPPSPTPKTTPTTTPATCEATSINVSPGSLILRANIGASDVTVTVTGEDNCAVEGETVTATIDATGENYVVVSPSSAVTDANGQAIFTITALDNSGNATIVFQAGSLKTTLTVSVRTQESIVFGFVIDEDDNPLKGVTVTITGNNSSDSAETDDDGYYEFTGLSKGDYTLTYEKEGYQTQTQDIGLKEGEVKDLPTVTMEQVEKAEIYGYVVNIKGDPLEFVRLRLKGVKTKVIKTASSDADGFFEFTDLDADTYVIFAKKKGYKKTQQKVTLGDGESQEIEIVMRRSSKRVMETMEDGQ
ncbi:MAG: carboxypeptidase regulatory-like domain-containing protein [Planctomycetes bacterium]|nr:carboxypeptidase regulatory-like domain-containing protein [Planctomycetota bacterium]